LIRIQWHCCRWKHSDRIRLCGKGEKNLLHEQEILTIVISVCAVLFCGVSVFDSAIFAVILSAILIRNSFGNFDLEILIRQIWFGV